MHGQFDRSDPDEQYRPARHVLPGRRRDLGTFTEEDKVTGVDQGTGVVYTGHSTVWANFNVNQRNANDTFTNSIHVTGSDGSTISYHDVMHETWNANGDPTVSIDKPSLTCG